MFDGKAQGIGSESKQYVRPGGYILVGQIVERARLMGKIGKPRKIEKLAIELDLEIGALSKLLARAFRDGRDGWDFCVGIEKQDAVLLSLTVGRECEHQAEHRECGPKRPTS